MKKHQIVTRAISLLLIVCMMVSALPVAVFAQDTGVSRFSGKDRCLTAQKVAAALKDELGVSKFDTVIYASGTNFADALAGSYLSAQNNAPILLHTDSGLAGNVEYIQNNLASDGVVYILGGTAAVPETAETKFEEAGIRFERVKGKSRFQTNLEILKEGGFSGGKVLVCTARNFADSLSASATGLPILLVEKAWIDLNSDQKAYLADKSDLEFIIIGGTGAVSQGMEDTLRSVYGDVKRVKGKTRYETSIEVAKEFFPDQPTYAVLAYAENFPDGLCGGALAYAKKSPLILTKTGSITAAKEYASSTGITSGAVLGGIKLIDDASVNAIFSSSSIESVKNYTVTFMDYNGTVLKTQEVAEGSSATAPADPIREGYTFTGWSGSFTNVTSNLTLIAQYKIAEESTSYTVTFKNYDGTVLKTEKVKEGSSATAPANPTREGYTFTGWDKSFDSITTDLVVTAKYNKDSHIHTPVTIPGKAPTSTSTGLTEGSKCSECGDILIPQEELPKLSDGEYTITYYLSSNDKYLEAYLLANPIANDNPATYNKSEGTRLKVLQGVPGYNFEGWYDGPSSSATKISRIAAGETGDIELYAHWEKVVYTVTFDSPDIPVANETYTVDTGLTLSSPSWFGYTFVGWSLDGMIVNSIEPGTTGNITLHANWTSNRNKAKAASIQEPEIIEDINNGQYHFIFEIGTIENVPLSQIEYIGNSEGININKEYEYSSAVSQTFTDAIAKSVSNATTKTSSWTLSENWNDSASATNSHEEEQGKTQQKTDSQGNVTASKYYISNSTGGSTSSTGSAGGSSGTSSKVTEGISTGINGSYTRETEDSSSVSLNVEHKDFESSTESDTFNWNVSGNIGYTPSKEGGIGGGGSGGIGGSSTDTETEGSENTIGIGTEVSHRDTQAINIASSRTKNFGTEDTTESESNWDVSATSSSTWNSTSGYENSQQTSYNTELSNTISSAIYDRWEYSSTQDRGGENSETSSTSDSQQLTDEYVSTVEVSTEASETYRKTITYKSAATGYYRLVTAGTVHVFAVVGYDVATSSYFTYTYNVLDTERHEYLDYSKDNALFNDCENAILPFEVPYSVHEFISRVTARSAGLEVDTTHGIITKYTGNASSVVIPEYISVNNGDGTYSAVRIRGISASAFQGNTTITDIVLPKYIDEIPDRAFQGCTALETVVGYGVNRIGKDAFKGCTALHAFTLDEYITQLGDNAFDGVSELTVIAATPKIAEAAMNAGAKKLTLNLAKMEGSFDNKAISIPASTEYFGFISNGASYSNLTIESEAAETFISNVTFVGNTDTPLKLDSEKVTLNRVTVTDCPGFALMLLADHTDLSLFGTITLNSLGKNTVLSKSVTLSKANSGVYSTLKVSGTYFYCGKLTNESLITGAIQAISADMFESMLTEAAVSFDANGGTMEAIIATVYYGQCYGTLPTPTREYYTFNGWFTEPSGGTQVTAETVVDTTEDHTLYAQWIQDTFKVTFDANGGSVDTTSKMVGAGTAFGALPEPNRDYYTFEGWYTAAEGGELIDANCIMTVGKEMTLYAHWTLNALSDWVLASEAPEDGMIEDTKWTYTLTTTKESKETSMAGFTQISSKWVQSGTGSKNYSTNFHKGFDTSHWIYTSFAKSKPYSDSETETTKRVTSDVWGGYVYWHWMYSVSYANTTGRAISPYSGYWSADGTSGSGFNYKYFTAMTSTTNCAYLDNGYCCSNNMPSYNCHSILTSTTNVGTPRFFRFEYRTCSYTDYYKLFTYQKVEDLESTTEVTASSTISNVQKWVQYRPKNSPSHSPVAIPVE